MASKSAWSEKSTSTKGTSHAIDYQEITGNTVRTIQRLFRFHLKAVLAVVAVLLFSWQFLLSGSSSRPSKPRSRGSHWHGWNNIEYLFTFGDSWSSNNFEHTGAQPSRANPIGNPAWPGDASCNGPNWVAWLTGTYNASFMRAYDLAHGAATIDRAIIPPLFTQSFTFREQVDRIFVPYYGASPPHAAWTPGNMLVAIWSGIVDVELFSRNENLTTIIPGIADSYFQGIQQMYDAGVRNFLLLKLPTMHRSPECENRILSQTFQKVFHENLDWRRGNFTAAHRDATVMIFETGAAFNSFLDHPREHRALDRVANFTNWCQDYNDMLGVIVDTEDAYKPECGVSIDRYFWINAIHPGFAVHNATSAAIVEHCFGEEMSAWCSW